MQCKDNPCYTGYLTNLLIKGNIVPTGYTAAIADGISFKEYALSCARAFGALIAMRDAPADAEIPEEFKSSTYHLEMLQETKSRLCELEAMSIIQATEAVNKSYNEAEKQRKKCIDECNDLLIKYQLMLDQAKKYVAPSEDHVRFREFMIEQITESIKFDCSTKYYEEPTKKLSVDEWLYNQIKQCEKDIEHHTKQYDEECKRVAERNEWVRLLRESLK